VHGIKYGSWQGYPHTGDNYPYRSRNRKQYHCNGQIRQVPWSSSRSPKPVLKVKSYKKLLLSYPKDTIITYYDHAKFKVTYTSYSLAAISDLPPVFFRSLIFRISIPLSIGFNISYILSPTILAPCMASTSTPVLYMVFTVIRTSMHNPLIQ